MPELNGILVACPACQHEYRAAPRLAGRQVPCPHCRRVLTIGERKTSDDRLVGKEIGGCTLVRRLGSGALGVVYEAEHAGLGRRVAVKLLSSRAAADPEVVARFQREARLAQQIRHPGVVSVFDCGIDRGAHFLVMEYVDGPTLAALVEDQPLPWREAVGYVRQIAEALGNVHAQEIIHRDIKPANILVGPGGTAKLADLGLAKNVGTEQTSGLTMQGVALGSPAYMPPEQINDAKAAGPRADLYALGATLFQCVTGRLAFEGRNGGEVMARVLDQPPPSARAVNAEVPPALDALILRLMAKDAEDRPADAQRLIADLDAATAHPDRVAAAPMPRRGRAAPPAELRRISPWLIVVLVALLLALALAAMMYLLLKS